MDILDKIGCSFFGFTIALAGVFLGIGKPVYFRRVEIPPTIAGWLLFVVGISLIVWALSKKTLKESEATLICPKCKTPFNQKDVSNKQCPICKVNLEKLKGFYERHPELKTGKSGN